MDIKWAIVTHVFNERHLLPQFIRHYSSDADHILIYDNESTDKCCDLVRHNPKVQIVNHPTGGTFKYKTLQKTCLRHARFVWSGCYHYTSFLGVDEFLVPKIGQPLKQVLIHSWPQAVIWSEGFNVVHGECEPKYDPSIPLVQQCKYGIPSVSYSKPAVWRPDQHVAFTGGMHKVRSHHANDYPYVSKPLLLLHCKYFDLECAIERHREHTPRYPPYRRRGCSCSAPEDYAKHIHLAISNLRNSKDLQRLPHVCFADS